jgi:hypothetical protein
MSNWIRDLADDCKGKIDQVLDAVTKQPLLRQKAESKIVQELGVIRHKLALLLELDFHGVGPKTSSKPALKEATQPQPPAN